MSDLIEGEARRSEELAASAGAVWKLLADFGGLADWWPDGFVDHVVNEGEGVGMVREVHTTLGLVLREKLEAIDDTARTLELSLEPPAPVGIREYRARGAVLDAGPGRCRLEWHGRFRVPDEAAAATARSFLEAGYAAMFQGLEAHAGRAS